MKIRIEINDQYPEDEVVIHCRKRTKEIEKMETAIQDVVATTQKFVFYKGTTEYYLDLDDILFFETDSTGICAHTRDEVYQTRHRLYELEDLLPGYFMRVSKSTILNTNHIYAITRNLTAASEVTFSHTHKQVYVSRNYYKPLIQKLEEKRLQR